MLRAEQGPLMSPSPGLLPGGAQLAGASPQRLCCCREAVQLLLGLGFCAGGEGRGRLSGTLFTTSCFFTDEVGEWVREESPSSSPLHDGLRQQRLGHFSTGLCWLSPGRAHPRLERWGIAVACPRVEFQSPRALVVCFCVVTALVRELKA